MSKKKKNQNTPSPPKRVIFLVDGFNVYWSIKGALDAGLITNGKWLDYSELFKTTLQRVAELGSNSTIVDIYYFTAHAGFMEQVSPGTVDRHKLLVRCLEDRGVKVVLGKYKVKDLKCKADCKLGYQSHEEKQTDVHIAIKLFEVLMLDHCDIVVLVSGDSDLVPAVTKSKELFADKQVFACFPHARKNNDLAKATHFAFKLKADDYQSHQMPTSVTLSNGVVVQKPPSW